MPDRASSNTANHFVSKRDRRGYFRFVPIQLAEGRPLAHQLGIDPDRPDSFAFVANGQGCVKSEAVLRIARELPALAALGQIRRSGAITG